jgi:hypothetical protein
MSKARIKMITDQKEQMIKLMFELTGAPKELKAQVYTDMPRGGAPIDYSRLKEGMTRLEHMLEIEERTLNIMQESEKVLDDKLKRLEGIDYRVAYLIQVKNRSLQQVADELGYSIGYIKNISASINRQKG